MNKVYSRPQSSYMGITNGTSVNGNSQEGRRPASAVGHVHTKSKTIPELATKNHKKVTIQIDQEKFDTTYYILKQIPHVHQFKQEDGSYFVARPSKPFGFILQYLMRHNVSNQSDLALNLLHLELRSMHVSDIKNICLEAKYYQLNKLLMLLTVYLRRVMDPDLVNVCYHLGLTVSETGRVITKSSSIDKYLCCVTSYGYSKSQHYFEFAITSESVDIICGITSSQSEFLSIDKSIQVEDVPKNATQCIVFSLKDLFIYYIDHNSQQDSESTIQFEYGSRVGVYLDSERHLMMIYKDNQQICQWIPLNERIRRNYFIIGMKDKNSSVELLPFAKKPTVVFQEPEVSEIVPQTSQSVNSLMSRDHLLMRQLSEGLDP